MTNDPEAIKSLLTGVGYLKREINGPMRQSRLRGIEVNLRAILEILDNPKKVAKRIVKLANP